MIRLNSMSSILTQQPLKRVYLFLLLIQLNFLLPKQFNLSVRVDGQFSYNSSTISDEVYLDNDDTDSIYDGNGTLKSPQVILPQGVIQGSHESVQGINVNAFLGIPYANPPVGDQRFCPSRVISRVSNETIQATEYGPNCWEPPLGPLADVRRSGGIMVRSEDCLYLNIWTPETASVNKPVPVIVYIHGGVLIMYSAGDSKWTDGRSLAALGNVVVVTVNYRLGTLGFLFSGDSNAPGNLGLTDQVTALQWINKHISSFGGDPNKVILYGMSSGALTVSMLLLSGQLNNLIYGLAVNSGAPNPHWTDSRERSLTRFQIIASKVGCYVRGTKMDTSAILNCLRSKPPLLLTGVALDPENLLVTGPLRGEPFFPTLGSDLFPQYSIDELYQDHLWSSNISVLLWIVTDEGFAPATYGQFPKLVNPTVNGCSQHLTSTRFTLLPASSNTSSMVAVSDLVKTYCKGYESAPRSAMLENFNTLLGDWYINCPIYYFADVLADGNTQIYFGKFTYYNGSILRKYLPDFTGGTYGTRHGLDKIFMIGIPFTRPEDYSDSDRGQSYQLMSIYSRFANTGNPGWSSYQITSKGRIIPYIREVNSLKEISFTSINQDRIKCYTWNDIFHSQ